MRTLTAVGLVALLSGTGGVALARDPAAGGAAGGGGWNQPSRPSGGGWGGGLSPGAAGAIGGVIGGILGGAMSQPPVAAPPPTYYPPPYQPIPAYSPPPAPVAIPEPPVKPSRFIDTVQVTPGWPPYSSGPMGQQIVRADDNTYYDVITTYMDGTVKSARFDTDGTPYNYRSPTWFPRLKAVLEEIFSFGEIQRQKDMRRYRATTPRG